MTSINAYDFEQASAKAFRGGSKAEQDCQKMISRLNLKDEMNGPIGTLGPLFKEYVTEIQRNIVWYQSKLWRERLKRAWYIIFSFALLITVPIFVVFIPELVQRFVATGNDPTVQNVTAQNVTAQLTAVLTSLLALHRTVSTWLDKRKVAGRWAQTSAQLKELVWSFHREWDPRDITPAVKGELEKRLRDDIAKARKLTSDEQVFFFENMSYPNIDIASVLKSSRAAAEQIVTDNASAEIKRMDEQAKRRMAVSRAQALVNEYRALIEERQAEFRDALADNDKAKITRLNSELGDLYKKLNAAELDRATALADAAQ